MLYRQLIALWESIGPDPTDFDTSIDDVLALVWSAMRDDQSDGLPSPDDVTGARQHGPRGRELDAEWAKIRDLKRSR